MNAFSIRDAFAASGVAELPDIAYDQLLVYLELLLRWNRRFSLTSLHDPNEIVRRHLVECAFAAQHLPVGLGTLLDFGSGAGLPGIVFAICRPEISITLAEAHGKKASFLLEVKRTLTLGFEVYGGRVEDLPRERDFGAVSMRAVEKMETSILVALRYVRDYLILFATAKTIAEFQQLCGKLEWLNLVPLPNSTQMVLAMGKRSKLFHVEHPV